MPGELRPEDIRVGGKDQSDRDVAWVYWSTKDYAIYQWSKEAPAETFWQRWTTRRECGISPHFGHPEQRIAYAQIGCDLSRIHALQHGRLARRESVNREIARAVALALEGHQDEAKAILAHLKARLVNMRNIEGRASYLGACMSAMLFFLAVLVVAVQVDPANRFVGVFGNDLMLLKVATCGALGAFLSVCLRIKQLEIDPETPRKVNRVSGITRLVIGIAAGIVVYLAIGSGLVLSALGQGGQEAKEAATAGVLLLAVVAGFSEGFVPNILLKVGGEGNGADKAGDPTPTAPRSGRDRRAEDRRAGAVPQGA